jgi:hypothetical protein
MIPTDTTTIIATAVILAIGGPLAVFHRAIAKELRHMRAHFTAHHGSAAKKPGRKARG